MNASNAMNAIIKLITNFKDFYNDINAATLTGAIDVVVVRQEDGSYLSSPFHVRFGKLGVLRSREKVVDIEINGEPVDIHMKLGDTGEAYFLHPVDEDPIALSLQEEVSKAEEEARSQDSGYEPEDLCDARSKDAPATLTLRLPIDSNTQKLIDDTAPEMGVVTRVLRQDNSKCVKKDIQTQTDKKKTPVVAEDKDSSSADEVTSKAAQSTASAGVKKSQSDKSSAEAEPINPESNKQKVENEDSSKGSRSQRRKRRRKFKNNNASQQVQQSNTNSHSSTKSNSKKKGSSGSQSSDASTTSEVADLTSLNSSKDDGVFAMDDVKPGKVDSMPQSSSMPQLREVQPGASSAMKSSQSAGAVEGARQCWVEQESNRNNNIACTEIGANFLHPFSDTDISPPPSPGNSRPSTPIKSDTEYEVERHRQEINEGCEQADADVIWSWTWGQLPTPPVKAKTPSSADESSSNADVSSGLEKGEKMVSAASDKLDVSSSHNEGNSKTSETAAKKGDDEEAQRSMFGGMLSFMRATKKARHNPQSEGIYLEDLNLQDLDPEVLALYFPKYSSSKSEAVQIPGSKEEDLESGNGPSLPQSPQSVVDVDPVMGPSLDSDLEQDNQSRHPIFDYKGYHDVALSLCGRLQEFRSQELPETLFLQNLVTYDDFCLNPASILTNPDLVVRLGGKFYNWASAAPHLMSLMLFQRALPEGISNELQKDLMPEIKKTEESVRKTSTSRGLSWLWGRSTTEEPKSGTGAEQQPQTPTDGETPVEEKDDDTVEVRAIETQTSAPNTPLSHQPSADSDSPLKGDENLKQYKRSLRLTTEQIEQLNLQEGGNDVTFSVTTAYQGTTKCRCRIFLWNYDEKIIVSDIDGTITKSDVLGQLLPIIGQDWAQGGVAQLFTKIKNNGYNFLYLSARAIGQARITREYLRSVVQEDVNLPDGPLLLNPTSLLQAFHREVIERKSEEFKISCLKDIQALFPLSSNPFYAGYGNRVNDVWAYSAVGIPISRVFTINHKGELKHELTETFQSTYSNLSDIVHHMFPVYSQDMLHHGEYSSVRYWKAPLPDYDDEINKLLNLPAPATTQA